MHLMKGLIICSMQRIILLWYLVFNVYWNWQDLRNVIMMKIGILCGNTKIHIYPPPPIKYLTTQMLHIYIY